MENKPNITSEESSETGSKRTKWNFTEMLSDELFLDILLRFISDAKMMARVSAVNRRFRKILTEEWTVKRVLDSRVKDCHRDLFVQGNRSPFEQLGFYQAVKEKGLFEENRIGFDFASTVVDDDSGEASLVKGSTTRIESIASILDQFDEVGLIVEAHCGTAAPRGIAPAFSRARGHCCSGAVMAHVACDITNRIIMNPWGRRVAQRASASDHKHGEVAREGRGWAEVFLVLGGTMELPIRPLHYEGLHIDEEEEEDHAGMRMLW